LLYCVGIWIILALTWPYIAQAFSAEEDAKMLIRFFCVFVAGSFIFNGALYVANAAFNNLGFAIYSTFFNWGRATLGIIPFVYIGKAWGPEGVLAGWGLGGIVFGVISVFVCFRELKKLPERAQSDIQLTTIPTIPTSNSSFTSGPGASG